MSNPALSKNICPYAMMYEYADSAYHHYECKKGDDCETCKEIEDHWNNKCQCRETLETRIETIINRLFEMSTLLCPVCQGCIKTLQSMEDGEQSYVCENYKEGDKDSHYRRSIIYTRGSDDFNCRLKIFEFARSLEDN